MATAKKNGHTSNNFKSVALDRLPYGRKGKHSRIVLDLLEDLERLEDGRALKIPLSELPDTKANVRAALNRATRKRNLTVATASDDEHFYVWRPSPQS
jgi:hypothetical protein